MGGVSGPGVLARPSELGVVGTNPEARDDSSSFVLATVVLESILSGKLFEV